MEFMKGPEGISRSCQALAVSRGGDLAGSDGLTMSTPYAESVHHRMTSLPRSR